MLVVLDAGTPVLVAARARSGEALTPRTPFRWGSISKTVTALTLLEAARLAGRPLHTPVRALLDPPPYRNPWPDERPLRLAHLPALSAGLPDLSRTEFADNRPRPLAEALVRGAPAREMLWPPGLQHSYSNAVPGIAAAVIERLTGSTFEAAAERLVLRPLGMTGAGFRPVDGLPGGFQADGTTPIPYWHMTFSAFGALNAAPADMARLLTALLDGGRRPVAAAGTPHPSSIARMFRVDATLGARAGLEIGYGAGLYGWSRNGHLFHGHGGDADGYLARFGLLRGAGRGYLLGINADDPALFGRMRRIVEDALTEDLPAPEAPPALTMDPAQLAAYRGVYYPSASRFAVTDWRQGRARRATVEVSGATLTVRHGRRQERLLAVGPGQFRRAADPAVSVVFTREGGQLYLQGELGNFARISTPPCVAWLPVCDDSTALWPSGGAFGMVTSVR